MGLERYKLDKAFTDGVEIRLDDAPNDVFTVTLPSQYNREYMTAMYSGIEMDRSGGVVSTGASVLSTRYAQIDAFMSVCLKSLNGEPIPADFMKHYPAAVDELMVKATEAAELIDEKVEQNVKKSSALSGGKVNGQAEKISTAALSAAVN